MSLCGKEWVWPDDKKGLTLELAGELDVPPALARLLLNRGISDPEQARAFLSPDINNLYDPWLMLNMDRVVERLLIALEAGEKITVYGDYDADGITASVIMIESLRRCGGHIDYYLPSRFDEGYGLHCEPLKQLKENGTDLVITVDCGTNAVEEALYARELGLDLLITDHHLPLSAMPEGQILLNPLQGGCSYPYKELSGAGIAFKLATAIYLKLGYAFPEELLDLAALGTAADVVSVLDENRLIISSGLEVLRKLRRPGLKALADLSGLSADRISSHSLSFIFAPAINAAGRMGEALPAAEMLLENDPDKAALLAEKLFQVNQERRATERKILEEAEKAALEQLAKPEQGIITLAAESWHHGVIGIVASRLVEKFYRPVALIALDGDVGRGSARSIPGFDITAALSSSSDLLTRFGGHEQAAGFTIPKANCGLLRDSLNRFALASFKKEKLLPALNIEVELEDEEISFELADFVKQLEPFGQANPSPLFASRDWELSSWKLVGSDEKHLKLNLKKGRRTIAPIFFSAAALEPKLEPGRSINLAFRLKSGFFRENKTLNVETKDIQFSDGDEYGGLSVVDKRGTTDRIGCLRELVNKPGNSTAVFLSTLSSRRRIEEKCRPGKECHLITSGSLNGKQKIPEAVSRVILYELPLTEELIKPLIKAAGNAGKATIYLLFNKRDILVNRNILDYTLPTSDILRKVVELFLEAEKMTFSGEDYLKMEEAIGFKPALTFWRRVEAVITETGILASIKKDVDSDQLFQNWSSILAKSATFSDMEKRRSACNEFQKMLLESSPAELSKYFRSLV